MTTAVRTMEDARWSIATASGGTFTGYLPGWATQNPSEDDVPVNLLDATLAGVCHYVDFDALGLRTAADDGQGVDATVLGSAIECTPYAEDPEIRLPVVNLQIIEDYWVDGLDPDELAEIAAGVRAQADRLQHEVLPALIAARADWAAHHST